MNRRGFLSCAGALALAGCASRPLPPRATPAVASIEPAGLEALYAITPGRDGVVIRTASGGCTRKEDFVFYVERRGLTPTLAFARRRLDNCRSFAAAHADIKRFLETERMIGSADRDRARPADVDERHFAAVEKMVRAGFGDTVDRQGIRHRRNAADDHPVEMAVGKADFARAKQLFDDEAVAQALRVASCRILGPDDLAYVYGNGHGICLS